MNGPFSIGATPKQVRCQNLPLHNLCMSASPLTVSKKLNNIKGYKQDYKKTTLLISEPSRDLGVISVRAVFEIVRFDCWCLQCCDAIYGGNG
jgi:hypothetical protein